MVCEVGKWVVALAKDNLGSLSVANIFDCFLTKREGHELETVVLVAASSSKLNVCRHLG